MAGRAPDLFGKRERGAAIAVGHADKRGARVLVERQRLAFDRFGAFEELFQRGAVERPEHQHARAREQRRDQLERGVLGCGADEHDGAVLDHGQEGILLRAVEAVDFVDEEERPLPRFPALSSGVKNLLEVGDAGKDRGDLLEVKIGGPRQEARHRGLAGAGRAPEDERAERARLQHARESAVGAKQMILPDHVSELVGAQLVGKRPRRVALKTGGREQARRALLRARGHGPLVHFTSPVPFSELSPRDGS